MPDFKKNSIPDETQLEEFPISEISNILPILKLFDEKSLKRIDTIVVNDDVMEIVESNDVDSFGVEW